MQYFLVRQHLSTHQWFKSLFRHLNYTWLHCFLQINVQPHLLEWFHINYWTDALQEKFGSGANVHREPSPTHMLRHTYRHLSSHHYSNTSSCTAAQSLSVGFKAGFSFDDCQNIKWIMQCGRVGVVRSAFQSQHLTGFYPLSCKCDTCLIWHSQFSDPT